MTAATIAVMIVVIGMIAGVVVMIETAGVAVMIVVIGMIAGVVVMIETAGVAVMIVVIGMIAGVVVMIETAGVAVMIVVIGMIAGVVVMIETAAGSETEVPLSRRPRSKTTSSLSCEMSSANSGPVGAHSVEAGAEAELADSVRISPAWPHSSARPYIVSIMLRVGVFGSGGRMGGAVCQAVAGDPELELMVAVDPNRVGAPAGGLTAVADRHAAAGADVVVDFTVAEAARDNLVWLAEQKIHAVVGTTGFTDSDMERFGAAFTAADRACIIAPQLRHQRRFDDALRRAGRAVFRHRRGHRVAP